MGRSVLLPEWCSNEEEASQICKPWQSSTIWRSPSNPQLQLWWQFPRAWEWGWPQWWYPFFIAQNSPSWLWPQGDDIAVSVGLCASNSTLHTTILTAEGHITQTQLCMDAAHRPVETMQYIHCLYQFAINNSFNWAFLSLLRSSCCVFSFLSVTFPYTFFYFWNTSNCPWTFKFYT